MKKSLTPCHFGRPLNEDWTLSDYKILSVKVGGFIMAAKTRKKTQKKTRKKKEVNRRGSDS